MPSAERFFITGGQGFLGAWIARQLLREKASFLLFDLKPDDRILEQVVEPDDLAGIERVYGDVTDSEGLTRAVGDSGATSLLHLAGLQIPACRANPLLGGRVNVLGTLSVFEAARAHNGRIRGVVYASSAAVAGAPGDYQGPIRDDAQHFPRTHYGVFKTANEGNARVWWHDHGVASVGLRPLAVYGVGREVGITSGPTKAIKAAVIDREYRIPFTGRTAFNYVEDVAAAFIGCARASFEGARALNLRGEITTVEEFVQAIASALPGTEGRVRAAGAPLPVAYEFLETGLEALLGRVQHTPIVEGVRRTAEHFRRLKARGKLDDRDLEA